MLHWVHIYPFDVSYVHCGFFKASASGINVLSAPWFDMCTVASLSCIKEVMMSCPLVQYQAYNHLALGLGDYKPDIALVA